MSKAAARPRSRTPTACLARGCTSSPPATEPRATQRSNHARGDHSAHRPPPQRNVTLRINGTLHHIAVGRTYDRTPVIVLVHDLDVRVIHATTGELIRHLTIDPNRRYHGTGNKRGGPQRPYGPQKRTKPPK